MSYASCRACGVTYRTVRQMRRAYRRHLWSRYLALPWPDRLAATVELVTFRVGYVWWCLCGGDLERQR